MPSRVRLGENADLGPLACASDVVLSPDDEVLTPVIGGVRRHASTIADVAGPGKQDAVPAADVLGGTWGAHQAVDAGGDHLLLALGLDEHQGRRKVLSGNGREEGGPGARMLIASHATVDRFDSAASKPVQRRSLIFEEHEVVASPNLEVRHDHIPEIRRNDSTGQEIGPVGIA